MVAEVQGEEPEEEVTLLPPTTALPSKPQPLFALGGPLVKVSPAKAHQPLAQRVQQVHGPKVATPQQPLAQPAQSIPPGQQDQGPRVLVQTPVQMQDIFLQQYLHELVVGVLIWGTPQWQGFDRSNKALQERCPVASAEARALGFQRDTTCDPDHMHKPCS